MSTGDPRDYVHPGCYIDPDNIYVPKPYAKTYAHTLDDAYNNDIAGNGVEVKIDDCTLVDEWKDEDAIKCESNGDLVLNPTGKQVIKLHEGAKLDLEAGCSNTLTSGDTEQILQGVVLIETRGFIRAGETVAIDKKGYAHSAHAETSRAIIGIALQDGRPGSNLQVQINRPGQPVTIARQQPKPKKQSLWHLTDDTEIPSRFRYPRGHKPIYTMPFCDESGQEAIDNTGAAIDRLACGTAHDKASAGIVRSMQELLMELVDTLNEEAEDEQA